MAHFVPETCETLTFEILISNLSRELYATSVVDFPFLIYELIRNVQPPTKKHKEAQKAYKRVVRTELMTNERTAFNRRKAEKKPVTLDTFRLQSRRTPLVHTQLLLNQSIKPFIYPTVLLLTTS